jgi:hypothetical protein
MSYHRSQIILGLWSAFARKSWTRGMLLKNVPKVFVRRVCNFLDLGIGITADRRAGQKGVFQEYEIDDAVELGIGLSLQNAGMPQSEIVAFLRGSQEAIRTHIRSMPTSSVGARFPHFLIVTPHALSETIRQHGPQPRLNLGRLPFFEPRFVATKKDWLSLAEDLGSPSAASIVVEIGDLISSLEDALPRSAAVQRGRQCFFRQLNP